MDLQTLSWNTRPPRARRLDAISIAPGMNYSYQFPCPSDSLHAFEFSAAEDFVDVEWSQNHSNPNPGEVLDYNWQSESMTLVRISRGGNAACQCWGFRS
jgi:Ubiquitin 3 binding protein But2 C-terminal domain